MVNDDFVIDNEKVHLHEKLEKYLPFTKQASIAVGYFFISGFAEIMDHLKTIENSPKSEDVIRLLISPTTNRLTAEAMLAGNEALESAKTHSRLPRNREESEKKAKDEVRKTLEYMPQSEKELGAVKKLIELISKKKLQIKVYTKEQLHAKAYIFEYNDKSGEQRIAIVGSSNLSISGIKQHAELNIITGHKNDTLEVKEWFDNHWNDESSVNFTETIANILEQSWAGKEHTPEDVYGKAVIHEHEDIFDESLFGSMIYEGESIKLFDFQQRAVSDAIKKIENYGGVIIADVVGMGKTYIGSAILKYLKEHKNSKPLVICPPHLIDMWKLYLKRFDIYGEVESRYMIGTDENILRKYTHCDTILIDESHHFRNATTNAYKALLAFMEEKTDDVKIIMLSATPVSNGATDLKNQLRLFPVEKLESIPPLVTITLDVYFKGVEENNVITQEGVEKLRELLQYIMIRRTRTQILKKYALPDGDRWYLQQKEGRKYFPKRRLQNPEEYDADKVYDDNYEAIESAITDLKMARYAPGKYIKEEYAKVKKYKDLASTTIPLVGITRALLLKRMESSIAAFAKSIENYQKGYSLFKKQLKKGVIPIGKEFHDEIYKKIEYDDYDDDELEKNLDNIKSKYDIEAFDIEQWQQDLQDDEAKFALITGFLQGGGDFERRDDKLHKLCDLIEKYSEKILIFSESAVTTKYIHDYIKKTMPARKIAHIDSKVRQGDKTKMIKQFDPKNNEGDGIQGEIDILISTDVLSEGVNLHAARIIINYDFHWNPVRLIQRVGRIDRIGSEHPMIDIYNFLPTTKIDVTLALKDRVANKIKTIRKIIGHDQQILETSEIVDEASSVPIYDPSENADDVLDSNVGLLDMEESDSEKHADKIKKNKKDLEYFIGLQFGLRSASGKGKLLIACEAEETILDHDGIVIPKETFRQHYEVVKGTPYPITASSFLKQVGDNSKKPSSILDSDYNESISIAWKKFNDDIKNTMGRKKLLKHQMYFDKELKRIATNNPSMINTVSELSHFVKCHMLGNFQPYRKLVDLHKRIDSDPDANDDTIINGLNEIKQSKYGKISYKKIIKKPRILYSLMVSQ